MGDLFPHAVFISDVILYKLSVLSKSLKNNCMSVIGLNEPFSNLFNSLMYSSTSRLFGMFSTRAAGLLFILLEKYHIIMHNIVNIGTFKNPVTHVTVVQ